MQLITSQRIYLLAVVASLAVSAFTLASLFGRLPYLELATHFRLQYALAASACVILLICFHSWKLLPLALCCAVLNWGLVLPYYASSSRPAASPGAMRLRLMHVNVLWANKDYAALTAAVADARPDVMVLQEFTVEWQEQLQALRTQYPYSKAVPRQRGSGMALFSRYPLEVAEVLTLDASSHPALLARVDVGRIPLSVLALHPPTPMRPDKFANRNE